jgi:anaerobic selenocysteine-containing dehydrogenase
MENITSEKRAICGVCPAGCWIIAGYDKEGRLAAVRPEDGAEFGITCKLGDHGPAIVYAESRLRHPLRRKGPKGTYEFERISWDDAYAIVVENLNRTRTKYGPEAAAIYTGRGGFELAMCDVFQPRGVAISSASSVLFPFGSPNTFGVGSLCYVSFAMIAPHVTMGGMLIDMFSDIENAEMIVVWGANPATDSPPIDFRRIVAAVERGARLVVIDPRRTRTAKLPGADWIPIRPGTDGALALGLCQVLIEEERFNEAFVRNWVYGFEAFADYTQRFRPEVVETITGVPAEIVRSLARRIAGAKGAAPIMYTGLEYSDSGVQAIRATFVLWALAGQLDVPGGRCFRMRQNRFQINREGHVPNPDASMALGRDRFPLYNLYRDEAHPQALPDAVLQGRPHAIGSLIILGASIITSWPQPEIWKRTLAGLDFLACIDVQMTADAAYADIVLPAATLFEIESYMTYGPIFRIRERVVPPLGESRNIFFIMAELAKRLGYGHLYPQNEAALLHYVLKGTGFTVNDVRAAGGSVRIPTTMMQYQKWEKGLLRSDGKPGFDTPTGKFEIASTTLDAHGYDALPVYTEPQEGPLAQPNLARRFPLVFNSGSRVTTDFRSQFHGIPELTRKRPEPTVTLNPCDAAARGICNGDLVCIRTLRGQVVMRAIVTEDIMAGTIDANMGGGGPVGPKAWQENNVNTLTDLDRYDPISGFPIYKALLCEIEKAPERTATIAMDSGESFAALVDEAKTSRNAALSHINSDRNTTTSVTPEEREHDTTD